MRATVSVLFVQMSKHKGYRTRYEENGKSDDTLKRKGAESRDHVGPMNMPRLLRDSLMQLASLRPSPDTPLSLTLSDPARSTITRELRTMLVIRLDTEGYQQQSIE